MALRCLIVDDSARFLEAARVLLDREGLDVVGVASNRNEAFNLIDELSPDLLLLDVDLGGDSGFEVARKLEERASGDGAERPQVILISTHAEDDLIDLIEASPVVGFLDKSTLSAAAIQDLLSGRGGHRRASVN